MKEITMYMAEDGTRFEDEKICALYEKKQKEIDNLLRSARRIKEICKKHFDAETATHSHPCASCPIWRNKNKMSTTCCPFMVEIIDDDVPITPSSWGLK